MGAVHAQAPCHRGRLGTLGERAGDHHRERGGHPDALRLRRLPPPELHPEIRHPGCHRPGASNRRRARRNHAHPPVRRSGTGPWRVHTADGDVPVVQVSVSSLEPAALLALGQRLRALRDEGILVIGSGFMTRGFEIMRDPGLTSYPHRLRRMGHRRLQPRRLRHAERLPSQGTRSRHRTPHLRPLRPPAAQPRCLRRPAVGHLSHRQNGARKFDPLTPNRLSDHATNRHDAVRDAMSVSLVRVWPTWRLQRWISPLL